MHGLVVKLAVFDEVFAVKTDTVKDVFFKWVNPDCATTTTGLRVTAQLTGVRAEFVDVGGDLWVVDVVVVDEVAVTCLTLQTLFAFLEPIDWAKP